MSDEMFNQHAAISDLQQAEELAVDQHKLVNEWLTEFLPETRKLYAMTNYVEYDQDGEFCINCTSCICFMQLILFEPIIQFHRSLQRTVKMASCYSINLSHRPRHVEIYWATFKRNLPTKRCFRIK